MRAVISDKTQSGNMSIRQRADAVLDVLPDDEIQKVLDFAMDLVRVADGPFKVLTEQDILDSVDLSKKQIREGKCQEMGEALLEIGQDLGLLDE